MKETTIQYIGLESLRPSNTNPRKHFDENYIAELSDSIKAKGILQPLLTRPDWCIGKSDEDIAKLNGDAERKDAGFFEIVAGECRFRGASKAKLSDAPAIVRLLSDKETLEIQLIENLQRSDLTAVEEAQAYRRLIDEMGYTVELIHEKTGKATKTIYGKLKMLRAPKVLLDALEKGLIGERFCELVGRVPTAGERERAAQEILHPKFLLERSDGTLAAKDQPMSYRVAADHIRDNYMRSLAGGQFDQADAALVPPIIDDETGERIGGGSCNDCPMRSGNRPELAGDLKRPDICGNPRCFSQKTDAHFFILQKNALAEGKKILSAEEAAKIFEGDGSLSFDSPYEKLSGKPDPHEVRSDFEGRMPTWGKLLESVDAKPQIAIAKDPRGHIVELVDRGLAIEAVKLAAKQKGERSLFDLSTARAGSGSAGTSDTNATYQEAERKKREAAKLNFKITLAVMTELIGAIDKKGAIKGFWDVLIEASITHAGHDGAWLMCKRLGLDAKNHVKAEAAPGVESAVLEFGLSIPDEKWKLGFVVELLLSQRAKWSNTAAGGLKAMPAMRSFLDLYKIDVAAIERQVKADGRVKAAPRSNTNLSGDGGKAVAKGGGSGGGSKEPAATQGGYANAPSPAQRIAKHRFEKIADNKYRCKRCTAFAVKHEGKFVLAKEFRGKLCVGSEEPRKASPRGKCSHCSNRAAPGKSMCAKCLKKNAARAKARRAKKGGVKK
jgi:ParB/RepB/Spo0J family partition protein